MSLRLDPRRLRALKEIAAEQGLRPGELVTRWVEERLDAQRGGRPAAAPAQAHDALAELAARVDELGRRVDTLAARSPGDRPQADAAEPPEPERADEPAATAEATVSEAAPAEPKPRTARPRRPAAAGDGAQPRIALHDEIIAVIRERGPMSAGELAEAIGERGRYSAPRSNKPLDAATVSARVSNPVYRSRFRREDGRIGLAEESEA